MTQVLEYIVQNYTWFLCGAILILLAIVGYHADKTNFGQNKNLKDDEKKQSNKSANLDENTLSNDNDLNDISESSSQANIVEINDVDYKSNFEPMTGELIENGINESEITDFATNDVLPETNLVEVTKDNNENQLEDLSAEASVKASNDSLINNQAILLENNSVLETKVLPEQKINPILTEEEIDKFNDEFNSILPEKELISTDLLSDIDDLELGKTQKIDLSEVPDLDDIELPKIKQLEPDEQDIWKF